MSITSTAPLEVYPVESKRLPTPKDPFKFGKAIQYSQASKYKHNYIGEHKILFNKGRYFETTIGNAGTLREICNLTGFKPQHTNMIVESWDKMEDFVIAMNILGIYVEIDIDWI